MLKINIISVSNLKSDYLLSEAKNEYLKRLQPYASINIEEIRAEPFLDTSKDKAKRLESEKVENKLEKIRGKDGNVKVFLLREKGILMDSFKFSKTLSKVAGNIVFVIAGALGFSKDLEEKYQAISLSPLTFTHEMAKVILLEQIFRAICIEKGKKYHY